MLSPQYRLMLCTTEAIWNGIGKLARAEGVKESQILKRIVEQAVPPLVANLGKKAGTK